MQTFLWNLVSNRRLQNSKIRLTQIVYEWQKRRGRNSSRSYPIHLDSTSKSVTSTVALQRYNASSCVDPSIQKLAYQFASKGGSPQEAKSNKQKMQTSPYTSFVTPDLNAQRFAVGPLQQSSKDTARNSGWKIQRPSLGHTSVSADLVFSEVSPSLSKINASAYETMGAILASPRTAISFKRRSVSEGVLAKQVQEATSLFSRRDGRGFAFNLTSSRNDASVTWA